MKRIPRSLIANFYASFLTKRNLLFIWHKMEKLDGDFFSISMVQSLCMLQFHYLLPEFAIYEIMTSTVLVVYFWWKQFPFLNVQKLVELSMSGSTGERS